MAAETIDVRGEDSLQALCFAASAGPYAASGFVEDGGKIFFPIPIASMTPEISRAAQVQCAG